MIIIKLCAKNDNNGNARRVFVLLDNSGDIVNAVDEGCLGRKAVQEFGECFTGFDNITEFETTTAEYRRVLKKYGDKKCV
jgi:hypothetical protein